MMFELFSLPAAGGLGLMMTSTGAGAAGGLTTGGGSAGGLVGKGLGTTDGSCCRKGAASANVDVCCGCAGSGHQRFRHAWQLKDPDNRSTNMIAQIIRDVFIGYFPSYKARLSYIVFRISHFALCTLPLV